VLLYQDIIKLRLSKILFLNPLKHQCYGLSGVQDVASCHELEHGKTIEVFR